MSITSLKRNRSDPDLTFIRENLSRFNAQMATAEAQMAATAAAREAFCVEHGIDPLEIDALDQRADQTTIQAHATDTGYHVEADVTRAMPLAASPSRTTHCTHGYISCNHDFWDQTDPDYHWLVDDHHNAMLRPYERGYAMSPFAPEQNPLLGGWYQDRTTYQ